MSSRDERVPERLKQWCGWSRGPNGQRPPAPEPTARRTWFSRVPTSPAQPHDVIPPLDRLWLEGFSSVVRYRRLKDALLVELSHEVERATWDTCLRRALMALELDDGSDEPTSAATSPPESPWT